MRSLLLALTLPATLVAQTRTVISRDSLQSIVSTRVAAGRSTGLVVGVLSPDGQRTVVSAGNERPGKPVDVRTVFEIGSITKTFTAIVLADMVQHGEVRLDQPVSELLPPGTRIPARNGKQITLGDLSSQISGLPRLPDNMKPVDESNPYADYTVQQMYDFLARYELPRDPGAQYEYSNLGVGLLGHALALRAGMSYGALVRERVLEPLGMTHTGIALTPDMQAHMSLGHDGDGGVVPLWDLPTFAGAGALRSSMEDMLRYLAANMSPPNTPLGRAIATSHTPRFTVNNALSLALNWHITNFRGDTLIWHNGGTAGFRTMIAWNPATHMGAVLLGNSSQDNEDIVRHILAGAPLVAVIVRHEVALGADKLREYTGTYRLAPTFALDITVDSAGAWLQATGQPRFRIYAEAPDKFFLKVVDAQLEFARDSTGRVSTVTLVQNGARNVGARDATKP
ncbi:MAG TPA: serine hydrolase [Gemmatimonadaceae bacterium]|nr:serine hydrolase [Gemmatimonadaceae bacterium]